MKRLTLHIAFGATALATGLLAGWHALQLQRATEVNAAIASADAGSLEADLPEARFARAKRLAEGGDAEAAAKAWKALIDGKRADLRQGAQYNLGNLHMRGALASGEGGINDALPLIELAKQRYRDALRTRPDDWNARYNLERALWLAPEIEPSIVEDDSGEVPRERVVTTLQGVRLDLP
ncbi:MAG: MxaK protein [Gammaproteobacteria bacterium]|nr:MxaK protein [Gammaproteobacteria bacterium]MBU0771063.1 MxaK protein [Gammaproteobacteria bacterium]MBU0854644.1 MxaK protein [Gammaproteobacteria bacterium]MBU1845976.1 MxaK protein [Gammaproteobacteria bacterium]